MAFVDSDDYHHAGLLRKSFTMRRRRPVHRWPCAITGRWTKP
ncbi:MAG: hypothetical protein ACLVJH_18900 [Faecalibacterium prausnitzii]